MPFADIIFCVIFYASLANDMHLKTQYGDILGSLVHEAQRTIRGCFFF